MSQVRLSNISILNIKKELECRIKHIWNNKQICKQKVKKKNNLESNKLI